MDMGDYDIDELNKTSCDPWGSHWEDEDGEGAMSDIDPDKKNYGTDANRISNNCLYYNISNLNMEISKHQNEDSLALFHLNIRSLRKNVTNFSICLDTIEKKYDVIALSETWLKDYNADLYQIDGYQHEFVTRDHSTGGGVSLFLQSNLIYKKRKDLNYHDITLDMLWVEVENLPTIHKNAILGVIYKAPGCDPTKFINKLQDIIDIVDKEKKVIFHMGDYNLDLIKADSHMSTS